MSAGSLELREAFRTVKRWVKAQAGLDVFVRPQCSVPLVTLGEGPGSWVIWPDALGRDSVLYSCGVGRDISFERGMIERYGLTVHAFDPTPLALAWVRSQQLPPNFHLHELGIAPYDGVACFQPPTKLKFESFSMVRSSGLGQAIEAPVRRFRSLTAMLGHTRVDVLKMDIEGAEYEVLPDLLDSNIPVGQILVEFHHRWKEVGAARTRRAIGFLESAGYAVAAVSSAGTEYTFIPKAGASAVRNSSFPSEE
ncbi:MAG TPA: FkbM family methyltransferase [Gemmatimonadales bacterium]|nr:FkbM family methyltransferase [Gemmatimonadales bacterium]